MVGVLVIGITQFSFAEDSKTTSHITVDMGMLEQPTSKYDSQKITITGSMGDYIRGKNITIVIVNSYEEETEINSLSSKKGKIHAFFEITENSHVGEHQIILKFRGEEVATTTFEILKNQ